ncbi:MAG: hypothetical protein PHU03_07325 [Syntrophales bacterium]|nr:hypothetical protein [Syntrophales bacterium]
MHVADNLKDDYEITITVKDPVLEKPVTIKSNYFYALSKRTKSTFQEDKDKFAPITCTSTFTLIDLCEALNITNKMFCMACEKAIDIGLEHEATVALLKHSLNEMRNNEVYVKLLKKIGS